MSIITPEVSDNICVILLPTITIYGENFSDSTALPNNKH